MPRGMVAALVPVLALVTCVGGTDEVASPEPATPSAAGSPAERTYWPTDGWRAADPADKGFDAEALAEVDRVVAGSYPGVRSIVVVRDGHLVHEHYRDGLDASDGHDLRSVTKSVVSALVGIALADGSIESLESTVGELLPELLPPEADPRMAGVTLRQLLSMSSGLPGDAPAIAGDPTVFEEVYGTGDRIRAGLALPLIAEPGAQWRYSTVSSDLLAVIVTEATGRSLIDFARERLFGPLGIATGGAYEPVVGGWPPTAHQLERYRASAVAWLRDARGYHWGGTGLRLRARDLAKIGFLYLNGGRWDGDQIVPAGYVAESIAPGDLSTGSRDSYGYQWWIADDGDHGAFSARGFGGQVIEVVPGLDLVAVVTSDPDVPRGDGHTLVENLILPAFTS